MTACSRNGALTAGMILIALGVIFLAENYYTSFSAWRMIARYWPVILIIIGVRRLYCYFAWPAIPPVTNKTTQKE